MVSLLETVKAPDFVEYYVFPIDYEDDVEQKLREINSKLQSFVNSHTVNYIWHKDQFSIDKVIPSDAETYPHLHGVTHYGENIEDEWFIVHLLLTFSEQCGNVVVKISDVDGDFLLIEAADHLPKWIKSENSNFNSFIHQGGVRVTPGLFSTKQESIRELATTLNQTISDLENTVTKTIRKKTEHFGHSLNELLHKTRAYVPAKVAALIEAKPGLIAHAITAYCERDPIDERVCRKMEHFPPNDMVLRLIACTKFLYAMISHQKLNFQRNRSAWNLPSPLEPNFKECSLGFKITCGFEILAAKNKQSDDLSLNKKWIQYNKVLKNKGYFKDLLEGSKQYVELEKKARIYFLDNVNVKNADSNCVKCMLQTISYDYNKMKEEECQLPTSDDEKWMDVDENELNRILEDRFGIKGIEATNSPQVLSSAINKFLNRASDVEGVELENEEDNEYHDDMDIDEDSRENQINFDPEGFLPSVERMIDLMNLSNMKEVTEELDSDSDYSDGEVTDDNSSTTKDQVMQSYMDLMDKELRKSVMSESFLLKSDSDTKSVDVDMNMLSNMIKSCEEQYGKSGPAGNLLRSVGLKLDTKK